MLGKISHYRPTVCQPEKVGMYIQPYQGTQQVFQRRNNSKRLIKLHGSLSQENCYAKGSELVPRIHSSNDRQIDRRSQTWKFPLFAQWFYDKMGQFSVSYPLPQYPHLIHLSKSGETFWFWKLVYILHASSFYIQLKHIRPKQVNLLVFFFVWFVS